jgi:hypothetical protein
MARRCTRTRQHQNLDYGRIAREILAEAGALDRAEDERFGDRRGDELPAELATVQGRRGWLREAKRRLDERRAAEARPIPKSRPERLKEAKRRLEEDHAVHCRANEAYEAYRARGVMKDGRRFGKPPTPMSHVRRRRARSTSPIPTRATSRRRAATRRATTPRASATSIRSSWPPSSTPTRPTSAISIRCSRPPSASSPLPVTETPRVVVADAGYWHHEQMDDLAGRGITVLIPPDAGKRRAPRPGWDGGRYAFMRNVLSTDYGHELYGKRQVTIEPVFANTKFNPRIDRFLRRGISACRSEWRLITATHNLLKLHRHQIAAPAPDGAPATAPDLDDFHHSDHRPTAPLARFEQQPPCIAVAEPLASGGYAGSVHRPSSTRAAGFAPRRSGS